MYQNLDIHYSLATEIMISSENLLRKYLLETVMQKSAAKLNVRCLKISIVIQ